MNVRRGNPDDPAVVKRLLRELIDELWERPFEPLEPPDGYFDDKVVVLAEARGSALPSGRCFRIRWPT